MTAQRQADLDALREWDGEEHVVVSEWTRPDSEEEADPDDRCTRCGGEGYVECDDPIQCLSAHIGGGPLDGGLHACRACGGSGRAADQVVW